MATLNKTFLVGNLTRDPESRATPAGKTVCNFSVAVNRKWSGGEEVLFMPVTAWEKTAEACQQYLHKGSPVLVEGRLREEHWEKDGQKRSRIVLVAENVQFLGRKDEGEEKAKADEGEAPF